ncbi:MAG: hypothetical protein LW860_20540 [Xanthomonadaceae bacterium]|jgi:hypothetical protein|nr:hypothetical protein [Xanthomonadaceae bacterium]
MDLQSLFTTLHIAAGTIALFAFWGAAFLRKGSTAHVRVGQAYLAAMVTLLAVAVPLVVERIADGRPSGWFLAYLLLITVTAVWTSWRAIRDKRDYARYTGLPLRVLGVLNLGGGLAMLGYGIALGQPLFIGFSLIGVFAGRDLIGMHRKAPVDARWWMREHLNGMTGNAIATHISFLSIGLPRLLPDLSGPVLMNLAWFGPLVVAFGVRALILRRWEKTAARAEAAVAARRAAARHPDGAPATP